jgi:hypothetical protein
MLLGLIILYNENSKRHHENWKWKRIVSYYTIDTPLRIFIPDILHWISIFTSFLLKHLQEKISKNLIIFFLKSPKLTKKTKKKHVKSTNNLISMTIINPILKIFCSMKFIPINIPIQLTWKNDKVKIIFCHIFYGLTTLTKKRTERKIL